MTFNILRNSDTWYNNLNCLFWSLGSGFLLMLARDFYTVLQLSRHWYLELSKHIDCSHGSVRIVWLRSALFEIALERLSFRLRGTTVGNLGNVCKPWEHKWYGVMGMCNVWHWGTTESPKLSITLAHDTKISIVYFDHLVHNIIRSNIPIWPVVVQCQVPSWCWHVISKLSCCPLVADI